MPRFSPPAGPVRATLRAWRAALARTFVQPPSVTLLTLDPEEVGRRVREQRLG